METIYLAGGCLWGVQEFFKTLPGVIITEAGRANGTSSILDSEYDGYAECVKVEFDSEITSVTKLVGYLFEIINPYSLNEQGWVKGKKYRTGVYSENASHLDEAKLFIELREDSDKIMVEVLPLTSYIRSADEHQDRLTRCPDDYSYCHIPKAIMYKYKS